MSKDIIGVRKRSGELLETFHQRMMRSAANDWAPQLDRLVVNLVSPRPATIADPGSFDAIVEIWGDDLNAFDLDETSGRWRVEEIVEKDLMPRRAGQVTAGLRSLPFVKFDPALDAPARRRRWAEHATLGLRIHTGVARFVRNIVLETLTVESVHGIGGLSFRTETDLSDGLFPTPESRAEFLADIQGFVVGNISHYATEHVVLWPPQ